MPESIIQKSSAYKSAKPFETKFADMIADTKDRLEVQIFEPGYDPSIQKVFEATEFQQKEWRQLKANLMQKDYDMGHTVGINLTYEGV